MIYIIFLLGSISLDHSKGKQNGINCFWIPKVCRTAWQTFYNLDRIIFKLFLTNKSWYCPVLQWKTQQDKERKNIAQGHMVSKCIQQELKFRTTNMDPMHLYLAQLCVDERAWGSTKDCTGSRRDCYCCFMESQGCAMWFSAPANSSCFGICVHDTSHDILSILVIRSMPVWSDPAVQTQICLPPGLGEVTQYRITDACPEFWLRPYSDCYSRQSGTAAFRPHPSSTLAETGRGGWRDSPNIGPATFVPSAKNKVRWNPFMTTPRRMKSVCTWGIQSTSQGQSDK